jgi:hypothetical protein
VTLKLSEEEMEDGRATPFVRELAREIRAKQREATSRMVEVGATGADHPARLHALAGMVAAYMDVQRIIGVLDPREP